MTHDIGTVFDLVSIDAAVPCGAVMNHLVSEYIQAIEHDGKDSKSLLLAQRLSCAHCAVSNLHSHSTQDRRPL